jgi:endoglucanase
LVDELKRVAENSSISYQMEAHPNASGTEAKAIQLVKTGTKTGIISYPVRYMHSPSEMIACKDVNFIIDLLTQFCNDDDN